MEKLTPKQRQTINRISEVLNRYGDTGVTLSVLAKEAELSLVATETALKRMNVDVIADRYFIAGKVQETVGKLTETPTPNPEILQMLDQLRKSASIILTQDNVGTQNPAYHVKEKRQIFGIDSGYTDTYVWRGNGSQERYDCDDDMGKALDTIAENLNLDEIEIDRQTFEKVYYIDQERTVTVCFTRDHAQDYIDANRHNLGDPFIYVESFNRNHEMLALRQLLMLLAENPTMLDGILDNA